MTFLSKIILLLAILAVMVLPSVAQVETGSITGTVRDATRASAAGATVSARNGWRQPI